GFLDVRRDPPPVADGEAVGARPLADRGAVPARGPPTRTATRAGGAAADLARVADPPGECVAELCGVRRRQVDLVAHAVERERDRLVGRSAVDVIDKDDLNFLGHEDLRWELCAWNGRMKHPTTEINRQNFGRACYGLPVIVMSITGPTVERGASAAAQGLRDPARPLRRARSGRPARPT